MVVIRNYSLSSPHNTRCWLYSRLTDVRSDEEESYLSDQDYQRHWTTDCNYSHHSESRWDVSRIISGSFIMNISAGNLRVLLKHPQASKWIMSCIGSQGWENGRVHSPPSSLPGHFIKRAFTSLAKTMSPSRPFIA